VTCLHCIIWNKSVGKNKALVQNFSQKTSEYFALWMLRWNGKSVKIHCKVTDCEGWIGLHRFSVQASGVEHVCSVTVEPVGRKEEMRLLAPGYVKWWCVHSVTSDSLLGNCYCIISHKLPYHSAVHVLSNTETNKHSRHIPCYEGFFFRVIWAVFVFLWCRGHLQEVLWQTQFVYISKYGVHKM